MQILAPMMKLFVITFVLFSRIRFVLQAPDTVVKAIQNRGHVTSVLDP